MPFQPGNNEGAKSRKAKPFRDALNLEIAAAGEDHKALRRIAGALLDQAYGGDMQAIKEVADRMDGKVPQAVVGGDEDDNPVNVLHRIERVIVRPPDQNG
jgi:hypothetical protein